MNSCHATNNDSQKSLENLDKKEASEIHFDSFEKKLIMEGLLDFIDAGNELNENDTYTLLAKHLGMRPKPIGVYVTKAPIITWVHASILQPSSLEFSLPSPQIAATLYHPHYEGEYYFTPKPKNERECVTARIRFFLLSLETPNQDIKQAIQTRKQDFQEQTKHLSIHPQALILLSTKITQTAYSASLKKSLLSYFNKKNLTPRVIPPQTKTTLITEAQSLLMLCDTTQKNNILTEDLMDFLLKTYYEIYCISKEFSEINAYNQEVVFTYFIFLKELLIFQNPYPKYNELIYLLLCGAFKNPLKLETMIKAEPSHAYFNLAIQCNLESEKDDIIQNAWANAFRYDILKFILFQEQEEIFTQNEIILILVQLGDKHAAAWLTKDINSLLLISDRTNISQAIRYYSTVAWLKNIALLTDHTLKYFTQTQNKIKTLNLHLIKSALEENRLLTLPLTQYISNNNPHNPVLIKFLQTVRAKEKNAVLLLGESGFIVQLKSGRQYTLLTENEFNFLLETCQKEAKSVPEEIRGIILLDLYYQLYIHIKSSTENIDKLTLIAITEQKILALKDCQEPTSLLYETSHILLFHLSLLAKKIMPTYTGNTQLYFSNAIQACRINTITFKSEWVQQLRKEALIQFAQSLSFFMISDLNEPFKKISKIVHHLQFMTTMSYHTRIGIEYIKQAQDMLHWVKCMQLIEPAITLSASKPHITKTTELLKEKGGKSKKSKIKNTKKDRSQIEENKEVKEILEKDHPLKKIEEDAKQKQKEELEAKRKLEKQKKSEERKQKIEEQRKEIEAKEALDKIEKEKENQLKQEAREQRALQQAQEEARKKQEQEQRTQLQAAKRAAKQAEKALKDAEKLEVLAQLEIKTQKEAEEKRLAKMEILKTENLHLAQEREFAIVERPLQFLRFLRNFRLGELSPSEISIDNLQTLQNIDSILGNEDILELFGSYTVFLASLRLGIPIEQIRTPGDIDLRIKLKADNLLQYEQCIKQLLSKQIGFTLNDLLTTESLQAFIQMRIQNGGFISLSKPPLKACIGSKEIELSIILPTYRINTNPFRLLKHHISIKNNTVSFNSGDLFLTRQLGEDILENVFACNIHETNNLHYNVFNFFPRAIKNKCWGSYFNIKHKHKENHLKSLHYALNTLPFIIDFFKIRFLAHKIKDCYLEMVGLITQDYFSLPESKLITKGFLHAFFEILNIESSTVIGEDVIDPKIIRFFAKMLQTSITQNQASLGETKVKKEVSQFFYIQFIQLLSMLNIEPCKKSFLCASLQKPTSILFDRFNALPKVSFSSRPYPPFSMETVSTYHFPIYSPIPQPVVHSFNSPTRIPPNYSVTHNTHNRYQNNGY